MMAALRKTSLSVSKLPYCQTFAKRQELHDRIACIPGLVLTDAGMEGLPLIPLASLAETAHRNAFLEALDSMIEQVRQIDE
ncbi:MAG: hypothetical protein CBB71_06245 [Rhodopirellula sp. TMED11]|nr:MAG: hypothetical protein CBB71_06245 [Rhodopirellula sp. TMED11]